jgi:hypothetical protein
MMIDPVMWCQPQDAVGGRPKEWWVTQWMLAKRVPPQQTLSKC